MSIIRTCVAVCAAILLIAAGLGGRYAHADGRLGSIRRLFSSQKSYVILADYLHTRTPSDELADNIKEAASLPRDHPDIKQQSVRELVQAFGSLESDSSNLDKFCGTDNLTNLRRVTEAMRDGGNLGPKKITNAINHLNRIVIKAVESARNVCGSYLSNKWPNLWAPKFTEWNMKSFIEHLDYVATSYLYEGFVDTDNSDLKPEFNYETSTISVAIDRSQRLDHDPSDPHSIISNPTEDKAEIAAQLSQFVYKPCSEFVNLDETNEVLVPFNEMLKSWYAVSSNLLDKYYTNENAYHVSAQNDDYLGKKEVRYLAFSYQACRRLLASSADKLAKRISKYRAIGDF